MQTLKKSSMKIPNYFIFYRHRAPRVIYHTIPDQNYINPNAQDSIALAHKLHL